jgi:hypothetical protein
MSAPSRWTIEQYSLALEMRQRHAPWGRIAAAVGMSITQCKDKLRKGKAPTPGERRGGVTGVKGAPKPLPPQPGDAWTDPAIEPPAFLACGPIMAPHELPLRSTATRCVARGDGWEIYA